MLEVGFETLLLLLAAGFVAGFMDAVAGGGGPVSYTHLRAHET